MGCGCFCFLINAVSSSSSSFFPVSLLNLLNKHYLHSGIKEAPIPEVCETFNVARGMVQSLQENAGRFASVVL